MDLTLGVIIHPLGLYYLCWGNLGIMDPSLGAQLFLGVCRWSASKGVVKGSL